MEGMKKCKEARLEFLRAVIPSLDCTAGSLSSFQNSPVPSLSPTSTDPGLIGVGCGPASAIFAVSPGDPTVHPGWEAWPQASGELWDGFRLASNKIRFFLNHSHRFQYQVDLIAKGASWRKFLSILWDSFPVAMKWSSHLHNLRVVRRVAQHCLLSQSRWKWVQFSGQGWQG